MKKKLFIAGLFLACLALPPKASPAPLIDTTKEINWTADSTSYGDDPYHLWEHYLGTWTALLNPTKTNHNYSTGRSGSSWENQFEAQQQKWEMPLWASFNVDGYALRLATENGGYATTNPVIQWGTNLNNAPPLFWDGTSITNEGNIVPHTITHLALGAFPDQTNDVPGNAQLDLGCQILNIMYSQPPIGLYSNLYSPWWSNDFRKPIPLSGFYTGGHPFPAGHLCMALQTLINWGAETNFGGVVYDFKNALVASTNHCVSSFGLKSGNSVTFNLKWDRMPLAWDVPDGTITNDARGAFVINPTFGTTFLWTIQVTNLPAGTYNVFVDGSNILTATDLQLSNSINLFTNYNGPFWAQRKAVLNAKRDQQGVDHVTLISHSAGSQGTLGVGDMVNFKSNGAQQYDTNGKRGQTYLTAMATFVSNVQQYDVAIHNAAVQTNHTLAIVMIPAGTSVGNETATTIPSVAKYHMFMGRAPSDGSVETLNPPMFKVLYKGDSVSSMGFPDTTLRTFRYQLWTNSVATPLFDVVSSNNFYSCFDAITNADGSPYLGTCSWQVIWMNSNASAVVSTSAVHSFTLAPTATKWNRAKYMDPTFMTSYGAQHPHMFFTTNNEAAMAAFLHSSTAMGFSWNARTNEAKFITGTNWWNNDAMTNQDPANIAFYVAEVSMAYQIDSNAFWKSVNPGQMVDRLATSFIANGEDQQDVNALSENPKYLALAYDWAYSDMTTVQRSNVLWTLEKFAQWYVYADWWYAGSPYGTNRLYTNTSISYGSSAKVSTDHPQVESGTTLFFTFAGMGESAFLRDCQTYALNYTISQFESSHSDQGRGYAEQSFRTLHAFSAELLLACFDPAFTNVPWLRNYPMMNCYLEPLNYAEGNSGQRGDFGMRINPNSGLPDTQIYHYKYYDVASLLQDGRILRQWDRNFSVKSATVDFFPLLGEAFLPFYFPTNGIVETPWTSTIYTNWEDGYVASYQYEPSDWNCFSNGVGFTITARPGGNPPGHPTWHDGDVEMFAYGASVTHGGIGQFYKHPWFQGMGLYVDGIGINMPNGQNPYTNIYSHITGFTNTVDFTYVGTELGAAYNNVLNTLAGGGLGNLTHNYQFPTNTRPYVQSVQRHLLFAHKKYLVDYDKFATTTNATFLWKMNQLEPTLTADTNNVNFSYTVTNYFNGSNVTVYVWHIVSPTLMKMDALVGTNNYTTNPITTESFVGLANIGSDRPEPEASSMVEAYNKTPGTNWHFMSVIFPVKWGHPAPTVTRLDDLSVVVNDNEGTIDTNTFNPSFAGPFTFMVNITTPSVVQGGFVPFLHR